MPRIRAGSDRPVASATRARTAWARGAARAAACRWREESSGELAAGDALEHGKRRACRLVQRTERQVRRLLEHELSRRGGVHHLVRIADPRRSGREADFALRAIALIAEVGLRRVVKAQHQMIVF